MPLPDETPPATPAGPATSRSRACSSTTAPFNLVTDDETGLTRVFIPSRLADNPALLENDPGYINRLKAVGTRQLVRAWLEGDWDVIEGAFFPEFAAPRHVIPPFPMPD